MSAEWAELKTYLGKGFETSKASQKQDEEKASERSGAGLCAGQNGGAFLQTAFLGNNKDSHTNMYVPIVGYSVLLGNIWKLSNFLK